jgi:hypothetical protein
VKPEDWSSEVGGDAGESLIAILYRFFCYNTNDHRIFAKFILLNGAELVLISESNY